MELVAFVGLLATIFSTLTLVPSIYYQYSHKAPGGTSVFLLIQIVFNNILWISYGVLSDDMYIFTRSLIAEAICILSVILYYKYSGRA